LNSNNDVNSGERSNNQEVVADEEKNVGRSSSSIPSDELSATNSEDGDGVGGVGLDEHIDENSGSDTISDAHVDEEEGDEHAPLLSELARNNFGNDSASNDEPNNTDSNNTDSNNAALDGAHGAAKKTEKALKENGRSDDSKPANKADEVIRVEDGTNAIPEIQLTTEVL
jgi:hypothetical protein